MCYPKNTLLKTNNNTPTKKEKAMSDVYKRKNDEIKDTSDSNPNIDIEYWKTFIETTLKYLQIEPDTKIVTKDTCVFFYVGVKKYSEIYTKFCERINSVPGCEVCVDTTQSGSPVFIKVNESADIIRKKGSYFKRKFCNCRFFQVIMILLMLLSLIGFGFYKFYKFNRFIDPFDD